MAAQAALAAAIEDAKSIPLDAIDVSRLDLWSSDTHWPYFERLRREDPIHYCAKSEFGAYWSITRFNDIMAVDTNHEAFSSDREITIFDESKDGTELPMFIAMDPPKHDAQRKVVSPIVAPGNLARMESLIRERAVKILDALPVGETFDWVDKVSIELTTQMLATLFDFPFEDRRKLTYWSDVVTTVPGPGRLVETPEEQLSVTMECLDYFIKLWNERVNAEPAMDLISMLAHAEATRNMGPMEYLGNVILLIVGGNDTTRNTITGSILALNQNPEQYQKLRENPALIPSMVSETIRWQTPLAHMRRTATRDVELNGKHIKKGDKVIMWYVSGNRDDAVIENPNAYIIDRERPRQHISFGFGIHRCVGNRLAEMQLRVIWEEILKRFPKIEVVGEPVHIASPFTKGYGSLLVRIPPSNALPPRPAAFVERAPETHAPPYRQPLPVFVSACTVSSVGGLLFNIMPALLGSAAARFALDDAQVGIVGSSMLAGFALVAATSRQWINRFDWRGLVVAGTGLSVVSLAAAAFISTYGALLATLFGTGMGLGLLYTVTIAIVSENHKPDQAFGIKLASEVLLAIVAVLLLTQFVQARWGFAGTVLTLAAISGAVSLAGLPGIPARRALVPPDERFAMLRRHGTDLSMMRDWAPWLGLGAMFVSFGGLAALWAFLTQIAPSFGVNDETVAVLLMIGLAISGTAGIAAAVIGDRFGREKPLTIGMLLAIAGVVVLMTGHGLAGYFIGALLAVGVWNFPMAYQMGIIASSDPNGRVSVLMPAALAIGSALGPVLGGALLSGGHGYIPLYALFAVSIAASLVGFTVLARRLANRSAL
ncbi:MAG: cytochrome P450 [Alphaproteobacteria bacterium]|nr:cytochrome P450 [Alphaproteobacteria bacterium]MBL7099783.1 cytochrome P450 [Alphaproteobacteria bacterium]